MKDVVFENTGLSCATKEKNPVKQLYRISGVPFLVIDESHVRRLSIGDKNDTWFEQIPVEDGILLKIRRIVF